MISVSVIGLGRVGLISLFHLAQKGFAPYAVDKDKKHIQQLKNQNIRFIEPEFDSLLKDNYKKIKFLSYPKDTKCYFVCVPTPFNELTQQIDLSFISSVLKQINKISNSKKYVFIRSTLTPGNCRELSNQFQKLSISYFPEFLREGHFIKDFKKTRFSVLGFEDSSSVQYFSKFGFPSVSTCSLEEAEILKSVSNLFHGLKVSFANEVGRIAKAFNSSPHKIMDLFLKDTKLNISKKYLKPGFSFGGPCLKKDINSLQFCQKLNKELLLAKSAQKSNEIHTKWVANQILKLQPKSISLLGASFTASQTIDYRDSSVLSLIQILSSKKLKIYVIEKGLTHGSFLPESSIKQFMKSDVFILGGWTPLLKKYINLLLNYKGRLFDLLIQDLPEKIKKHPNYKTPYSK